MHQPTDASVAGQGVQLGQPRSPPVFDSGSIGTPTDMPRAAIGWDGDARLHLLLCITYCLPSGSAIRAKFQPWGQPLDMQNPSLYEYCG